MMNIKNIICSVAALLIACAGIDAKIINRQPAGEIPFSLAGDSRIYVSATVNGSDTLNFLVDTGSDRVLDLNTPFVNSHNLLDTQKPFAISRISSSDGGSGELKNVFFEEVRIGQYVLPKVAGAFSTLTEGMQSKSDIDGTLGNNFLKRFNMVIDFDGQTIWLQPNNYLYTPFYGFLVK